MPTLLHFCWSTMLSAGPWVLFCCIIFTSAPIWWSYRIWSVTDSAGQRLKRKTKASSGGRRRAERRQRHCRRWIRVKGCVHTASLSAQFGFTAQIWYFCLAVRSVFLMWRISDSSVIWSRSWTDPHVQKNKNKDVTRSTLLYGGKH